MDLSTTYLGLKLPHPLMPGASPLVDDLGTVRRLEDAGAAAIVMHSLFEEQIVAEQFGTHEVTEGHAGAHPEASSYFPSADTFALGPDEYVAQVAKIKNAVRLPVIGSLNGSTRGGWLDYARLIEQAGADALELNVYTVATDPWEPPQMIERRIQELVRAVRSAVKIPIAVKLSPFFTSLPYLAQELDAAGADGLVIFNRFYQPDIDLEQLEVQRSLQLSDSSELLLRLRWLAILSGRIQASLAVTGGIHTGRDALKAVMCGAHAVQLVSALLRHGVDHLRVVRQEMVRWMEEHEYTSLDQMRGSMSLARCPSPKEYERANYMHILQSWRGEVRQGGSKGDDSWCE